MTVEELIEKLSALPKDTKVFFAKDTSEFWIEVKELEYREKVKSVCLVEKWP